MKIMRVIAIPLVMLALMFGMTQVVAPTPASASSSTESVAVAKAPPTKICKDARFNWRLTQKVTYAGYNMWSYYSSSHDAACLKAKRRDGDRSNFLLKVIRKMRDGTKKVHRIQQLDRVTALKAFGRVGRSTDVVVYAAPVPKTVVSYKGKFRLRF